MLLRGPMIALIFAFSLAAPLSAATVENLYQAAPSVTGVEEPERLRGFREGLQDVIVRVTGDASLAGSPRIAPLLDTAPSFVASYAYEDEMKGLPKRDEQGTRDRPHQLTIQFDKEKCDAAIEAFGFAIWGAERPLTAVFLGVKDASGQTVVSAEGKEAYGPREVLRAASARRGVPIVLPSQGLIADSLSYEAIAAGDSDALIAAAKAMNAEAALYGALEFDGDAYWNITWTLIWWGHDIKTWDAHGVTYDVSLRAALENAASLYSALAR